MAVRTYSKRLCIQKIAYISYMIIRLDFPSHFRRSGRSGLHVVWSEVRNQEEVGLPLVPILASSSQGLSATVFTSTAIAARIVRWHLMFVAIFFVWFSTAVARRNACPSSWAAFIMCGCVIPRPLGPKCHSEVFMLLYSSNISFSLICCNCSSHNLGGCSSL